MNCLSCFQCQRSIKEEGSTYAEYDHRKQEAASDAKPKRDHTDHANITSQHFTFRELATATRNFRQECLLGEGGFGRVYKGTLSGTGQVVAVKQLDRHGLQGNKEFLVEVLMLSQLHNENLVKLVGYCADGEQRLLVYEYLSGGSLEDHLFDIEADKKPLDWVTRMRIAFGAAQGLEYLHDKADPPVIYRDLKCSNILLDSDCNSKLSDFGLAKLGPANDKNNVSSRVMGTYGYCAPEFARTGQLTVKSDVYSFGVVLLELITGRRAIDHTRHLQERNLVTWAQPKFRDPKSFPDMADPLLEGRFPEKGLNQTVAIAAMCLQEEASVRPLMSDVVTTLGFLMYAPPEPMAAPVPESLPSEEKIGNAKNHLDHGDKSDADSHSSGGPDTDRKGSHSKNARTDVAQDEGGKHNSSDDEEDDNFPTLFSEDKEYDSSDSSSMISFSLGGSPLSRDKSNKSHGRSISSYRQVSLAFSEKSISSRNSGGGELSRKSSRRSKRENDLLSPRGRVSSWSNRSSDSSHDEIDLITPKGSIASSSHKSSKKSPFGRSPFGSSTLSSKDKNIGVLSHKSSAKSHDGNHSDDSSSPRSSIGSMSHKWSISMRSRDESNSMHEEHGDYFGDDSMEGS